MVYFFFALAASSPSRRAAFRRTVLAHIILLGVAAFILVLNRKPPGGAGILGAVALLAGIVEGAMLLGWRLTQLPKSQALEFLLVSPLRPRQLFLCEFLVGMSLLTLATLSGAPLYAALVSLGYLDPLDLLPLLVMPLTWGCITGLALITWAYEPQPVRRWGERIVIGLIVAYLFVGILAAENLKAWLSWLPPEGERWFFNGFLALHRYNPFQLMRTWLDSDIPTAWLPNLWLELTALGVMAGLVLRSSGRLHHHFHELHYWPQQDRSRQRRPAVGDHPLSWWSVRRVMRYSGRINFWLIGGFGVLYSAYALAGPHWPAWLGKAVFHIVDGLGGLGGLAAALMILAAVPAAFQYGLWDSSVHERCRRLELLLLTQLKPTDFWHAAASAAWKRGRGYFFIATLLCLTAWLSGHCTLGQTISALAAGVLLWGLYFALGFTAFSKGIQANGLGMVLTVGLPVMALATYKTLGPGPAIVFPPASLPLLLYQPPSWIWVAGPALWAFLALAVGRRAQARCDRELRLWYERHHGQKVMS